MITSFTGEHEFLSNFHTGHPFHLPGWDKLMPSAEHAFQAVKAVTGEQAHWVLEASTPQMAKSRGRQVTCYPDWGQVKRRRMLQILLAKFADPDLADWLAMTRTEVLVEGNTWGDAYWGAVPARNAMVHHKGPGVTVPPPLWRPVSYDAGTWLAGCNWLGRLLMMVREVQAP